MKDVTGNPQSISSLLHRLLHDGSPAVAVTLIAAPRQVGAKMIIEASGAHHGSFDDVHLEEAAALANTAVHPARLAWERAHPGPKRGLLSSIGRIFASVFGEDVPSGYVDRYSESIWHGHPVVVVEAADEEAASRVSTILQELGGYDIGEGKPWRPAAAYDRTRQMQPRHIFPGSFRAAERDRAMAAARASRMTSDRETRDRTGDAGLDPGSKRG